jgi:hypothetical protein
MVTSYNILSVVPSRSIRDTQLRLATPTQRQFAVYPGGVAVRIFWDRRWGWRWLEFGVLIPITDWKTTRNLDTYPLVN